MENNGAGFAGDSKIEGVGTFQGGVYGNLKIDGVCTIEGDIEAESIDVNGVCTCNGNVSARIFDCDGVLTIEGNLRAGTIDVDGVVTVNGNKIEADRIACDGVLSVEGEISADVIEADGKLNAEEIVGDRIVIKSYWKRGIKGLFTRAGDKVGVKLSTKAPVIGLAGSMKFSTIGLIEGTVVDIRGVRAKSVSGQNVYIGKNCEIDRVEAGGELEIHKSSVVKEVVS